MDFEEQISNRIWSIPCSSSIAGGHCAVSTGINKLVVFPSPYPRKTPSTPQTNNGMDVLHVLSPSSWLFSRHTRQLVNEAMGTFRSVQAAVEEAGDREEETDLTPLLINSSREYRSMLQACVVSLNSSLDNEDPNSDNYQEMAGQCELLYKMELLLGLTEIIFVDARPGSLLLSQLVCWVRLHYTSCTEQMVQVMAEENPSEHQLYWRAIYGLVCQGRLSDARQLLQQHPHCHTDAFTAIEEMLRKMPTYQVYSGVSEGEFMLRWQHWQSECESRQLRGDFSSWGHLNKLSQILCGNIGIILSVTSDIGNNSNNSLWVPHLLATLLYTQPNIKLHRLHAAALRAIDDTKHRKSALDELLLAAMEGDALQVVRGCQQSLDNLWLSAHLTDLLQHAVAARNQSIQPLAAMRDSIVQDYALELADHSSLWQVGVIYLDYCGGGEGGQASPLTTLLLERVPITNDAKAHKLINMAQQRNLHHVASGVCRVMGRRASAEGRLASAIWWGVRAADSHFTAHTANQVLQRYLSSGELHSSALLLDHLGSAMLISDTLTFLGKYREFHSLYQKEEYRQAADLLVTLLSSKLAPQYFWPVLLLDALPLLQQRPTEQQNNNRLSSEPPGVVVSAAHTYELMYCLNTVTTELHMGTNKQDDSSGLVKEFLLREEELRACLIHNLARAIVSEGSVDADPVNTHVYAVDHTSFAAVGLSLSLVQSQHYNAHA